MIKAVIILTVVIAAADGVPSLQSLYRTTADRIREYNYPVQTHTVHTSDGYILTLFRIPYSRRLQNRNKHRPVAFLQHGFISSSDGWILNGPDNALPYILADAGYDVWLGNVRGNTYSKRHQTLSPSLPSFWNFSWHEIAVYDVAASFDYILDNSAESALHYVGHSMGTTVFFVLMSVRPEYNAKIKTAHLLAPVGFTDRMKSPSDILAIPFVKNSSIIRDLQNVEIMANNKLAAWILARLCAEPSPLHPACLSIFSFLVGWNSTHLNTTLFLDIIETHPAGSSSNAFIHFGQEYVSGHFRCYDHGPAKNLLKYKQITPPDYNVSNIVAPVRLYYSDNDYFADVDDVKRIEALLPNVVESFHVPHPDWNHVDFLFANEVKEILYDRIVNAANHFEATAEQVVQ